MARLVTSGGEIENPAISAPVSSPEFNLKSGTVTRDTANQRSGAGCYKCDSAVGNVAAFIGVKVANSASTTYYVRGYYNFANLPTTTSAIILVGSNLQVRVDGSTSVAFAYDGTAQIGSSSSALTTGTFYRIELKYVINASSQITDVELRIDGTSITTVTAMTLATGGADVNLGFVQPPGASKVLYLDDVAVNDSSGAAQNTWPGDGKIIYLKPISLNTNGGSWTDDNAATTSAALTAAIDNTPPKGIADTTSGGGDHQVRNAGANSSLDMNLTTYTTGGVGASDTVNVVVPVCCVAAPVSTQAKSGSFGITTNPTIGQRTFTGGSGTPAFFWRGAAAGTYPSNWGWEVGTTTYAPAVTLGNSPVARLSITAGTTTRIAMCCDVGLLVDYTPPAPAAATLLAQPCNFASSGLMMKRLARTWNNRRRSGLLVPDLWVPAPA